MCRDTDYFRVKGKVVGRGITARRGPRHGPSRQEISLPRGLSGVRGRGTPGPGPCVHTSAHPYVTYVRGVVSGTFPLLWPLSDPPERVDTPLDLESVRH